MLLRLSGLSITVLYEGGGRQQVAGPGTSPGRFQRGKEIPEATPKTGTGGQGGGVKNRTTYRTYHRGYDKTLKTREIIKGCWYIVYLCKMVNKQ